MSEKILPSIAKAKLAEKAAEEAELAAKQAAVEARHENAVTPELHGERMIPK